MVADGVTPMHECRIGDITCGCRPENNDGAGACGKVPGRFSPKENPASDFVGS